MLINVLWCLTLVSETQKYTTDQQKPKQKHELDTPFIIYLHFCVLWTKGVHVHGVNLIINK